MPTPRLHPALLCVPLLVPACVRDQDLGDPAELLTASGSSGTEGASSDDAGSVSATSTTGAGACASNPGAHTILAAHAGPDADPQLSGLEDVAFSPSGEVSIAFIQGNNIWAQLDTSGDITFSDPPGTLAHAGYIDRDGAGRHVVAADSFTSADDWLQLTAADGSVLWNAAPFEGITYNALVDEVRLLSDGTALAHAYWVDNQEYARLLHFDADGVELARYDLPSASHYVGLFEGPGGEVWGVRGTNDGSALDRFVDGAFEAPASSIPMPGRWAWRATVDSQGRLLVLSRDVDYNVPAGTETIHLDILDRDTGTTIASLDDAATPDFHRAVDVAAGPCGEIFVVGGNDDFAHSWVASVDDDGVLWSEAIEYDGARFAHVAEDGTLTVVGETSIPDASVLTVGPWIARWEP